MNILKKRNNRRLEKGQTLYLIAVGSVALVAMLGLVIDGAMANLQKRHLQNAVDAATWAATAYLRRTPSPNDTTVVQMINYYDQQNGSPGQSTQSQPTILPSNITAYYIDTNNNQVGTVGSYGNSAIPSTAVGITLTINGTFQTSFMSILNINNYNAATHAAAKYGYVNSVTAPNPPPGAEPIAPLSLDWNTYQQLIAGSGYSDVSFNQAKNNGNGCYMGGTTCFFWNQLDDNTGNNSGDVTAGLIQNPNQYNLPPISIGSTIYTTPGNRTDLTSLFNTYYVGKNVIITIIENGVTNSSSPVDAFAYLHIDSSSSGAGSITGHLVNPNSVLYPGPVTSTPPPHSLTSITGISLTQ